MTFQTVTWAKQGILTHFSLHAHGVSSVAWLTILRKSCSTTGVYIHLMNSMVTMSSMNSCYSSSQEISVFYTHVQIISTPMSVKSILILSFRLCLGYFWSNVLPRGFLTKHIVYISHFTMCGMSLTYIILLDLIYLTVLSGECKLWSSVLF
jgi:hypothetical protein